MRFNRCLAVGLVFMLAYSSAALGDVLPNDPNAYNDGTTDWRGTVPFDNVVSFGHTTFSLSSDVDYAVYAPGKFDLSFGSAADPSNGSQYVYAYQLFDVGGNQNVTAFSVGFADSLDSSGGAAGRTQVAPEYRQRNHPGRFRGNIAFQ